MHRSLRFAVVALTVAAASAHGQFSSDFPGVPRAAISITGSSQERTALTFTGFKVPGVTGAGDTLAGGMRLAIGRSFRVQSDFEIGFDMTLADGHAVQPPSSAVASTGTTGTTGTGTTAANPLDQMYIRGLALYGLRIGAKWRVLSALDPDGHGYAVSIGGAFQPPIKALWGIEKQGDSTRMGGQFQDSKTASTTTPVFQSNPFATQGAATILSAMASYRSKRVMADVAVVSESGPTRAITDDPSPTQSVSGISPRGGASFRLTPGFAVGASYWGAGSAPWYDQVVLRTPGQLRNQYWAPMFQFGSDPESGLDLMVSSPTGNWAQSLRIYFRWRST